MEGNLLTNEIESFIAPDPTDSSGQFIIIKQGVKSSVGRVTGKCDLERLPERGSIMDLWRYCRICACAYQEMVPIYGTTGCEQQLEEKINNYLPITVSAEDVLPLQLCQLCVVKLNTTHDLIVSCLESSTRFTQFMESKGTVKAAENPEPAEECVPNSPSDNVDEGGETGETPTKKKVVVLKLVHSNSTDVSPSARIAKALEFLKLKNKEDQGIHDSKFETSLASENASLTFSNPEKKSLKQACTEKSSMEMDKLQVASIAEFCVITSGKDGPNAINSESPKLESKISKALGTVDNGTKQRIVQAVQNIVSKRNENRVRRSSCIECDYEFETEEEAVAHVCFRKNFKQGRGYENTCKICNKRFKDAYKLTVHKQVHKKDSEFTCSECGKKFGRQDSLYIHQMVHKGLKPHACKQCDERFLHRSSLELHLNEVHQEAKPWICNTCQKYFGSFNLLRLHNCYPVNTAETMGKCCHCSKSFRNEYLLKEHKKVHQEEDPGKTYPCQHCPKIFKSHDLLLQHEPIHVGARPYQCGICSIGFIRKGNLTKHYKTHSAEKIITCVICKATFPTVAGLLSHRKTHSNEDWDDGKKESSSESVKNPAPAPDSYQCSVCNKYLSSKLSLSLHMRVHTGEKPYECDICNKRFTQKPALTYHKRLHTGERPHACQFCGKGFNSKVGKESHERIHTGERPYKCGQCGVGFRCSANLRQHTWIHTDNRPFICEVCSKLFRRREALQVHMRIHTGERPYSCPICGRSFTQKGDMLKHTRSHSKKNLRLPGLECQFCGQVFTRKVHHKLHMEKCKEQLVVEKSHSPDAFINCEQVVLKEEDDEEIKTVTITSEDMIPKFSDITIVTNEIQEYEVEYQS